MHNQSSAGSTINMLGTSVCDRDRQLIAQHWRPRCLRARSTSRCRFDPVDDFQMIATVGYQSFMVAVRADSPIKTVAGLVAAAKAQPAAHLLLGRRRLDAASAGECSARSPACR